MKRAILSFLVCVGLLLGNVQAATAGPAASDQVKAVQQALNEAGYDCGKVDGLAGKKTEAAVKAYEKDKGLPVDGVIDDALLEMLGITEEPRAEDTYKSYTVGDLVFEAPGKWISSGSEEDLEEANIRFRLKEDPETALSIMVSRQEESPDSLDDQTLKDLAEEAMSRILEQPYDGKAGVYSFSNGSHAAMLTDVQKKPETKGDDSDSGEYWVFITSVEGYLVSVLVKDKEEGTFPEAADEFDQMMSSLRRKEGT